MAFLLFHFQVPLEKIVIDLSIFVNLLPITCKYAFMLLGGESLAHGSYTRQWLCPLYIIKGIDIFESEFLCNNCLVSSNFLPLTNIDLLVTHLLFFVNSVCLTSASSSACAVEVCSNANVVSGEYWLESASARKVMIYCWMLSVWILKESGLFYLQFNIGYISWVNN